VEYDGKMIMDEKRTIRDDGLKLAIEAAGGLRKLARLIGVAHGTINKWNKIPADHIAEIEELTGIARERLRPDLYRVRK
jgi:DNA-binding transcriptional regulator YdaS (Cro superfamily)